MLSTGDRGEGGAGGRGFWRLQRMASHRAARTERMMATDGPRDGFRLASNFSETEVVSGLPVLEQ